MERYETQTIEEDQTSQRELAAILRVLSRPDTVKILSRAETGISNSTYAMEELNLTPKKYYYRLNELLGTDLITKRNGVYRQTTLGRIMYGRFLPAMGKTIDAKNELGILDELEGTKLESEVRKRIEEELGIPVFENSTNVKLLGDYESLAIEAIDLYDSAEESVLLASNYIDVRVMEACFRSVDRGITNRLIVDKKSLLSKIQSLRGMLSLTFTKTIINFASSKVDLKEFLKFVDLPYTFCIVDGHHNIIELSNTLNNSFIVALSIDDRGVSEKLTKFYEKLWKAGKTNAALNILDSIKSS